MKPIPMRAAMLGMTLIAASLSRMPAHAADMPPVAAVRPVTANFYGTEVVDRYRYLEDLQSPEVKAWMQAQADYTRTLLDQLPGKDALAKRIESLMNSDVSRSGLTRRGERYFYLLHTPGAQQPRLYYRDGLSGEEHLLVDPDALGKGSPNHFALDFYQPSGDGKLVAYGLSQGGSEQSTLHVMEVSTGKVLDEAIDRTASSVVAWRSDNRSFFYMRFPKPGPNTPPAEIRYNARTHLHMVGKHADGEADPAVFGRGVNPRVEVPEGEGAYIRLGVDSRFAIAKADHNMDSNPGTLYIAPVDSIKDSRTPWRKWADAADGVVQYALKGDKLYFLTQKDAPRFKLMVTSASRPDIQHAKVVVPEGEGVITHFSLAKDGIYLRIREGAPSSLFRVSESGGPLKRIPLPFEGAAFAPVTDAHSNGAVYTLQSWVRAPKMFAYDPASDSNRDTGMLPDSSVDTSAYESKEGFAIGHDGTRIPLSIMYKKGIALDGSHPTILSGYGGYAISREPAFSATRLAWLERGGILAEAHIRGGGEYGEAWHQAGMKLNKLNTIFDFIACGQYLVDQRYTSPQYLAASGGSAGGITVGRAMTFRPDLFAVILDSVGVSDTLRFETEPNGPPNAVEMGNTSTEPGFRGLFAMSPYQHIRDGVAYPSVLFMTGANDPRVAPWHMAKMTARLQAATGSANPVLLRVDYHAGHGMGSSASQRAHTLADQWAFALWRFGDAAFQPARK
ncbi:prolyl oligopeptidase family serine peptidase [Burkholderiaceae bacterium DAT-1]|nr:prolyl oligopeptidase family serine peptidase [Burkholderiaceae bacterium DAT-1]